MVFQSRGLAVEWTGPADIKGVDVTCCRMNSGLGEFPSWVLRLHRERTEKLLQYFAHYSSSLSRLSPSLTLPPGVQLSLLLLCLLQGDILTVIRRVDENWIEAKLGDKVGVCPLQFTEVSSAEFLPFFSPTAFLNVILQAPSRLTTRQFGPLPCNESDRGCSYL